MTGAIHQIKTIAKWEIKRFAGTMSGEVLPIAIVLFIGLIIASGFAQQSGIHLQDDIFTIGTDTDAVVSITSGDNRFSAYKIPQGFVPKEGDFDLVIIQGVVYASTSDKSQAALTAFDRDYSRYIVYVYNREKDLYAAYPVWIEEQYIVSNIDFVATQSGQMAFAPPDPRVSPVPEYGYSKIPTPSSQMGISAEELRKELISGENTDSGVERYTDVLSSSDTELKFKTPAQLSPSLPFDSIILVFVFIFPLYFTSQFFMMSIMNERIERNGEALLSAPIKPYVIIIGKGLPYFLMMLAIATMLTVLIEGTIFILFPIFPVILFFLSSALLIGMISRSFKELSFISIFFSTVATSYLFFPSIFANIHVISMISPLTLVIYQIQGESFTFYDYIYSTSLFFLTSAVIFYLAARNFNEERLFNYHKLMPRMMEFIESVISKKWTNISLFGISICTIPFVFMAQLMLLVLLFNLPMPYSVIFLLFFAAFIEEFAKSVGIYTLICKRPHYLTWKNVVIGSFAVALGFLTGEKLLLFATLAEISDSIFGAVLFASLQVLWLPLSLHFIGILTTATVLKAGGRRLYVPALILSTIVHSLYNLYFILGWSG
ncbi:MAG: ABC transporter permease [Methanomicrobiaceae archaeon]|nr:ABC transporter permease [Methanomicrobiaceae archaeon]